MKIILKKIWQTPLKIFKIPNWDFFENFYKKIPEGITSDSVIIIFLFLI